MSQVTLANAVTTTGAQTAVTEQHSKADRGLHVTRPTGVFQIEFGSTGTATLEGRLGSSYSWVVLGTYTVNSIAEVVLCPEMRLNISANANQIDAALEY